MREQKQGSGSSNESFFSGTSYNTHRGPLHVTFQECRELARNVKDMSRNFIEGLPSLSRSQSLISMPVYRSDETLEFSRNMAYQTDDQLSRSKTCHGCHGDVGNGAHMGSAVGKERCTLPHSLRCPGNIIEDNSWRACPPGYCLNPDALFARNTGFESTLDQAAFRTESLLGSTPARSDNSNDTLHETVVDNGASYQQNIPYRDTGARPKTNSTNVIVQNRNQQVISSPRSSSDNPNDRRNDDGSRIPLNELPPHILRQIEDFRASNQEAGTRAHQPPTNNLTITDLRKMPILREQVDHGLQDLRENIPSLSRAPTANVSRPTIQPSILRNSLPANNKPSYEWLTDSSGRKHLIKLGEGHQQTEAPVRCYVSHDQPPVSTGRMVATGTSLAGTEPDENFRIEYRCSPSTGRTWRVRIPVTPSGSKPDYLTRWEWRVDPYTGQRYQVEVTERNQRSIETRAQNPPFKDPENENRSRTHLSNMDNTVQIYQVPQSDSSGFREQPKTDVAGISRLDNKSKKNSSVIEYARNCPAKWAKSTSNSSINLPLYSWSILAELEAAMSGRHQPLQDGELLGKLRHLKNTMEVCCLNSSNTDFTSYGWLIAKDYAFKVEDEVMQGLASWQSMDPNIRTNSLVSAQMDCQRTQQKTSRTLKEDNKVKVCTTYNKCTTKNKCEYELLYPDKQCQRKHECSWCRTNANQSNRHQEWDCRKKEASG